MSQQPIPKVVKLDAQTKERLDHLGERKNRSTHWLMKEAIVRYLEQEEYNEALKQETLKGWRDIEEGRVVSHKSVSTWLDTWGTDEETDRPSCGS
jgi:predicted transcriptional regulator